MRAKIDINIVRSKKVLFLVAVSLMAAAFWAFFLISNQTTNSEVTYSLSGQQTQTTETPVLSNDNSNFTLQRKVAGDGLLDGVANKASFWDNQAPNIEAQAQLYNAYNQPLKNAVELNFEGYDLTNTAQYSTKIVDPDSLQPGKYRLQITTVEDGQVNSIEQDFMWGVLAINPNKSVYAPNEQIDFAMAVLDERGRMVCDAEVELKIDGPEQTTLSTSDDTIQVNEACQIKDKTNQPDYQSEWLPNSGQVGDYTMTLTATTNNGQYSIQDAFSVQENIEFDVERLGPTRILPTADYDMTVKVTPRQDFIGEVREFTQSDFVVSADDAAVTSDGERQQITWQANWQAGQTYELTYTFDAPDKSPEYYLLGELEMWQSGSQVYQEGRQWQIASDAITHVQSNSAHTTGGTSSTSVSYALSTTANNLLVVACGAHQSVTINTPTGFSTAINESGSVSLAIFYKIATGSESNITCTTGSNVNALHAHIYEYSDIEYVAAALDTTNSNTGTGTSISSGNVTTTQADSLLFSAAMGDDDAAFTSWGNSFTERTEECKCNGPGSQRSVSGGADRIVSSTGTYSSSTTSDTSLGWRSQIAAFKKYIPEITVTGNVYEDETSTALTACDGSTNMISLRVGGATYGPVSCNNSTGAFSIGGVAPPTTGDPIVIYIDGQTDDGTSVIRYDGTDLTDAVLRKNRLLIRHDDAGPVTNANAGTWDNANDADVVYDVDGSNNLTVEDGIKLIVNSGDTFTPGGTVTTSPSASSSSVDGDIAIQSSATLSMGTNALSVGGDFTNVGTFSKSATQTTTLTATATGHTITDGGSNFENVTFNGTGGGWSFADAHTMDGDLTMTAGTLSGTNDLTVNGGAATGNGDINLTSGTFTLDGAGNFGGTTDWDFNNLTFGDGTGTTTTTATSTSTITIAGTMTIAANQTLAAGSKTYTLTNSGTPLTVTGTLTPNTSSFVYESAANVTVATSTYYDLTIRPTSTGNTHTIASGTLTVSNNLLIGDFVSSTSTVNATTNDPIIDVAGDFTIDSFGTFAASDSASFTTGGNWTNSGTFTHNNGTVTLDGTAGTLDLEPGGDTLYNLTLNDGGGTATYELESTLDLNNDLTITGGTLDTKSTENNAITIAGNWTNNDQFEARSGTVTFDGAANTTLDMGCASASSCANQNFYNLEVNKTNNTDTLSLTATDTNVANTLTITRGELVQGALNVQAEGTADSVVIGANGTWTNLSTGNLALDGDFNNNGVATLNANGAACGGADDITITNISNTPDWEGSGAYSVKDVTISNQNATANINLESSTDGGSNTGNFSFVGCQVNLSGKVFQDDQTTFIGNPPCDSSTAVVSMRVNGGTEQTTTCDSSTGTYSFNGLTVSAGDTITLYLNGNSTPKANTILEVDGALDISNAHLYENHLVIRDQDDDAMAITDLLDYDDTTDSTNMLYDAVDSTPDTLTLEDGVALLIYAGDTFTPGGTVTTSPSASSSSVDGDIAIQSSATLSMGTNALSVGGDFTNAGTFSKSATQTTTLTATATGHTITDGGSNFENVTFNGTGGGWSFADAHTMDGDLTMTAGTLSGTNDLTVNGGAATGNGDINLTSGTFTLDGAGNFGGTTDWDFNNLTFGDGTGTTTTTATSTSTITIAGTMTIAANQTLAAGSKTYTLTNSGTPLTVTGTLTPNTSSFVYESAANVTVATSTYYDLTIRPTSTGNTHTIASGTLTVSNNLLIGDFVSSTSTVNATTNDPIIDVAGDFTIDSFGTFAASDSASFTTGGNWTNSGTFTHNNGTVTLDGTAGTLDLEPGGDTLYNLTLNDGGGTATYELESTLDLNNDLTITGGTLDTKSTENNAITIAGNWTNNDQFEARSGTVTFDGTASSNFDSGCSDASSCTSDFYNLTINRTGGGVTLTSDLRVSVTLTLTNGTLTQGIYDVQAEGSSAITVSSGGSWSNTGGGDLTLGGTFDNSGSVTLDSGTSCGADNLLIRSTSAGSQRTWTSTAAIEMYDVDVKDMAGTATITTYDSTNSGNNGGNFNFEGCPAVGTSIKGYIFENDDGEVGTTANTAISAPNTALTNVTKGERITARFNVENTLDQSVSDWAAFYDRNDGIFTKVKSGHPADTSAGNCTDTDWDCTAVDVTGDVGKYSSMAINPVTGQPWVAYKDDTNDDVMVAQYVGSDGTGCDGGSAEWSCELVQNDADGAAGDYTSLAFADDGTAYIAYRSPDAISNTAISVARYVGSGGSGCTSSAWSCEDLETTPSSYTDFSISTDGTTPWVSYHDFVAGSLRVASRDGAGSGSCPDTDWNCETVDDSVTTVGEFSSIAFNKNNTPYISYYDATNNALKIASRDGGGSGDCTDTDWNCETIDDVGATNGVGQYTSLAFSPSGNPWISYYDVDNGDLKLAQAVDSGGSGCTGADNSTLWDCSTLESTDDIGQYTSLAFAPDGAAWITYYDTTNTRLKYINNSSGSWSATVLDNSGSDAVGEYSSLAFDEDGRAWTSYYDGGTELNLKVANFTAHSGEISIVPGLAGSNGDPLSTSHVDMTSTSDTSNQADADCLGGATWNTGVWSEAEEINGLTLPAGDTTAQCTEVAFTIDTSQATPGETYRLIIASKDNWRADKGAWRGPVAIDQYATITIESDTDLRVSKDNTPKFADCTDTDWGCEAIESTANTGYFTSNAVDQAGVPWVAYYENGGTDYLRVATYVGSGGSGCDSSSWDCTSIDTALVSGDLNNSIAFDPSGNPWISYYDASGGDLMIAQFVGSGGSGCSETTAWTCVAVDTSSDVGRWSSIAFDPAGTAWIAYFDDSTNDDLKIAYYVGGSNGSGCADNNWNCSTIDSSSGVGEFVSIAFDNEGNPWISHYDRAGSNLRVTRYVGSGGTGCTISAWDCSSVDTTNSTGAYSSLAFDSTGKAYISYQYLTSRYLRVAEFVGGGLGSGCADSDWTCTNITTSRDIGRWSSISIDSNDNPWISSLDYDFAETYFDLHVAHYVGSGGTGCATSSWACTSVDTPNAVGDDTSIAFDKSGTPWISYFDQTNSDLRITKLHLPPTQPSTNDQIAYDTRSAGSGDARYLLDNLGYQSIAADDSLLDPMPGVANEQSFYTIDTRSATNIEDLQFTWIGQSNVSMATNNVHVQAYRFGSTNAWEDLTTESSCAADTDCTITTTITSNVSEYYESINGEYASYFRIYQDYHSTDQTLSTDSLTASTIGTAELTQTGYIWENDDGATPNLNSGQVAGDTAITARKGERLTLRTQIKNTGPLKYDPSTQASLFYDRSDGIFTKVKSGHPADTTTGSCADTDWDCTNVDVTDDVGKYSSVAINPTTGQPWIAYFDDTNDDLMVAQYVGSGGTGCDGGSSEWSCVVVDNDFAGTYGIDLAISKNGSAWIVAGAWGTPGGLEVFNQPSPGEAWSFETVDSHDNNGDYFPSITIDDNNIPIITYYDHDSTYGDSDITSLNYAIRDGGGSGNCEDSDWNCENVDDDIGGATDTGKYNSLAIAPDSTPYVSYYDDTNNALKIASRDGGGSGDCTDTDWNCETIDDVGATSGVGQYTSLAFSPSGDPWISYYDADNSDLKIAYGVGSGGSGCTGADNSSLWVCDTIDSADLVGKYTSIAFDPVGNPWVSYEETTGASSTVRVARYVTSGGNCDGTRSGSDAWDCTLITGSDPGGNAYTSLAFDTSGSAWLSYYVPPSSTLNVANFTAHSGEINISPGVSGSNGDSLTSSHADMTSASDTSNQSDSDCIGGGNWNSGTWSEAEEIRNIILPAGDTTAQCTEVAFTIDTSQATPGETYRIVMATKDNWRADKGPWRGPVAIDEYATITIQEETDLRFSKDNTPKFPNCSGFDDTSSTGSDDYGCTTIIDGDSSGDYYYHSSLAFAPDGTPYIVTYNYNEADGATAGNNLVVASYVGSGGNCDGYDDTGGSDAWQCTTIIDGDHPFDYFEHSSLAFDAAGNPYVVTTNYNESDGDTAGNNLVVANYVGSDGNCDGYDDTGGSDAWQCTTIIDGDHTGDYRYHSSLAFAPDGTPYIVTYHYASDGATAGNNLVVASYVGSDGNCDGYDDTGGSDAWQCTTIIDGDSSGDYFYHSSLAFAPDGTPYIVTYNYNEADGATAGNNLVVASYVGSGGNCDGYDDTGGSDAWQCTTIIDGDHTNDYRYHSSLAFDASGNPYIVTTNYNESDGATAGNNLVVASYVGSDGNCDGHDDTGGSDAWQCTTLIDGDNAEDYYRHSSLAFDAAGNPYVVTTNYNESDGDTAGNNLVVANYVGSDGNCDGYDDTGGSDAWQCTTIIDGDHTGDYRYHSSLAFDASGSPYIVTTNYNEADGATAGNNLVVAKLHLPPTQPSNDDQIAYDTRSAGSGDARYRLDFGDDRSSDLTKCTGSANAAGFCGLYESQGDFDAMTVPVGERPLYVGAVKFDNNATLPTVTWEGRTDVAPSTKGIAMQAYRYGTTNGWETIATDSASSDCTTANCKLQALPSGTTSEYFEADGSEYWFYFRIYQDSPATGTLTFQTDSFHAHQITGQLRGSKRFQENLLRPFSTE